MGAHDGRGLTPAYAALFRRNPVLPHRLGTGRTFGFDQYPSSEPHLVPDLPSPGLQPGCGQPNIPLELRMGLSGAPAASRGPTTSDLSKKGKPPEPS